MLSIKTGDLIEYFNWYSLKTGLVISINEQQQTCDVHELGGITETIALDNCLRVLDNIRNIKSKLHY